MARKRVSATERVENYIKDAICQGKLDTRQRILEEDIAHKLRCSRGPVREALLRLERDGLVITNHSRSGTFVRDFSPEAVETIHQIRGKLEALCARYMRVRMTTKDRETLNGLLARLDDASNRRDEAAFLEADLKLHQTIWMMSGREDLYRILSSVMNPVIAILARSTTASTPFSENFRHHRAYVAMILNSPIEMVEQRTEAYFEELFNEFVKNGRARGETNDIEASSGAEAALRCRGT